MSIPIRADPITSFLDLDPEENVIEPEDAVPIVETDQATNIVEDIPQGKRCSSFFLYT